MRRAALVLLAAALAPDAARAQFGGGGGGGGVAETAFYDTLGVAPGCTEGELKKAYRRKALQAHPDKGGDAEVFKQVNEAYAVLGDAEARARYDRFGKAGVEGAGAGAGGGGGNPFGGGGNPFGGMGGINPEDIFAQFFGGGNPFGGAGGSPFGGGGSPFGQQPRRQPRMPEQRMSMAVSLEEMYCGATKRVAIQRPVISGGYVRQERVEVDIKIAAGAAEGTRFRVRGGDAARADVELRLSQRPHARYTRRGDDLVTQCEVSLHEALTGFRRSLTQLDGSSLPIACEAEVSRPGQLKRVCGGGMPLVKRGGKGDLYLRMQVRFPAGPLAPANAKLLAAMLPRAAVPGAARPPPGARCYRVEAVRGSHDEAQDEEEEGEEEGEEGEEF